MSGMRIALVTPYSARSAISTWGRLLADDLVQKGHAPTIVRAESGLPDVEAPLRLAPLPAACPVVEGRGLEAGALAAGHDAIVYAVGNHFGHHAEVPRLLAGAPGVVVLHDADMTGFHWGWTVTALANARPAVAAEQGALLSWFGARALGAVVHARFYADVLRTSCRGPVRVLRLPFADMNITPMRRRGAGDPLVVATVGDANPNKRHESVIAAIGADPALRQGVIYRVLGHAAPDRAAALRQQAVEAGVVLELHGWLPAEALRTAMGEVDVFCCLRWPVSEGASASAIVGLLSGRPLVVANAGSFLDLPDAYVLRVPAGDEAPALTSHLLALLRYPEVGWELGAAARAWAREAFQVSHYADGLLDLLQQVQSTRPVTRMLHALDAEADLLGLGPDDPLRARVRDSALRAFDPAGRLV